MTRLRTVFVGGLALALSLTVSAAFAAWLSAGSGVSAARATTLPLVAQPSASASGTSVTVSWSQVVVGSSNLGALSGGGYTVKRYANGSATPITPGSACAATITDAAASLSCIESSVPAGSWQYAVTASLSGWRATESAKSAAVAISAGDVTPPALVSLQMLDTEASPDGKIDQVRATFDETLAAYSAGTAPWTLTSPPGGATLAGVSVSGSVATLTLNEGTADTAGAGFTISLATNANGIRDAAGNRSSFTDQTVADKAGPVLTQVASANGGSTGARVEANDTVTFTFTEALASIPSTVSVVVTDGGAGNDTWFVDGIMAAAVSMGHTGYIATGSATFVGSTAAFTDASHKVVRVTVAGSCAGTGCGTGGGSPSIKGATSPAPAGTLTDTASPANSAVGVLTPGSGNNFVLF